MNWVQFCIVMGYASFALVGMNEWNDWFDAFLLWAGCAWLIAAIIVALCGGGA
jgi:hypothetical protein